MASASSLLVLGDILMVPRSFPFTCTAMVTVSSTKYCASAVGQAASASKVSCPSKTHNSSARCGMTGPMS